MGCRRGLIWRRAAALWARNAAAPGDPALCRFPSAALGVLALLSQTLQSDRRVKVGKESAQKGSPHSAPSFPESRQLLPPCPRASGSHRPIPAAGHAGRAAPQQPAWQDWRGAGHTATLNQTGGLPASKKGQEDGGGPAPVSAWGSEMTVSGVGLRAFLDALCIRTPLEGSPGDRLSAAHAGGAGGTLVWSQVCLTQGSLLSTRRSSLCGHCDSWG